MKFERKIYFLSIFVFLTANIKIGNTSLCGCRKLRKCYETMINVLQDRDEEACIENASVGSSTIMVFLKALTEYCGHVIEVTNEHSTYESRHLYEVLVRKKLTEGQEEKRPVIIIEAGQEGGTEPIALALYIIEQLIACTDYNEMLDKVRWVILPCTNPDGHEYSRYKREAWKKNMRYSDEGLSFGVDITRNFDSQWGSCPRVESGFSPIYPGPTPASENETIFIKNILSKYKKDAKIYLSIKRDGHSFSYPYGYTKSSPANIDQLSRIAGEVTAKVNQRTGGVHFFINNSIHDHEGKPHCGHSVDYAYDLGIPLAYEMRVFLGSDNRIMSKFQPLPRGYETSLRNGYFSGIRELFNVLNNQKKYGKIT